MRWLSGNHMLTPVSVLSLICPTPLSLRPHKLFSDSCTSFCVYTCYSPHLSPPHLLFIPCCFFAPFFYLRGSFSLCAPVALLSLIYKWSEVCVELIFQLAKEPSRPQCNLGQVHPARTLMFVCIHMHTNADSWLSWLILGLQYDSWFVKMMFLHKNFYFPLEKKC